MIKLSDGELLDLLPSQLKTDPDMISLSYALKCAVEDILEYEKGTMTQNFIECLPEKILDVLAVELRSPYYLQDMDIETKRKIIAGTLIWHTKAGTPFAVREMIEAIFEMGELVEWFDFTEGEKTPGTFDIITDTQMTPDISNRLMKIILQVKNERSHLRRVTVRRELKTNPKAGAGVINYPHEAVVDKRPKRYRDIGGSVHAAAGVINYPHEVVVDKKPKRYKNIDGNIHAAVGVVPYAHEVVIGRQPTRCITASTKMKTAVAAFSTPRVVILN